MARSLHIGLGVVLASVLGLGWAAAADLVYVRDPGCSYCRAFESEIAPVYAKTPEGRVAPLKPVQIRSRDLDAFKLTRPVRYTPTFILVERGSEIGRIEGYPGDEFFWVRLARLFESLPRSAGARPR